MKKLFTYFIALSFALCMFAAPSMACQEANGSSATISTDEKSGGIGSGGLGISGGSAGPYLNHSGADNDLNVQLPT